jgi:hypothetical protein
MVGIGRGVCFVPVANHLRDEHRSTTSIGRLTDYTLEVLQNTVETWLFLILAGFLVGVADEGPGVS